MDGRAKVRGFGDSCVLDPRRILRGSSTDSARRGRATRATRSARLDSRATDWAPPRHPACFPHIWSAFGSPTSALPSPPAASTNSHYPVRASPSDPRIHSKGPIVEPMRAVTGAYTGHRPPACRPAVPTITDPGNRGALDLDAWITRRREREAPTDASSTPHRARPRPPRTGISERMCPQIPVREPTGAHVP